MPTINKQKAKPKAPRKETDMRKLRADAYNNTTWRKLRETYLKQHPLCERCLEKGKITPAEDVHHRVSPFKHGEVNYGLLLNDENLMSVCKQCHGEIHASQQGHISPEKIIEELDALFENIDKKND